MIEGMGLAAGLNESNDSKDYVVIHIVEGEYSCRESVNYFSVYDYYDSVLCDMRGDARRAKRRGENYVAHLEFWEIEAKGRVPGNKELARQFAERNDGFYGGTIAEYEEMKREQRREELEGMAKELAAKFRMKLSSIQFIEKLNEVIDGVKNDRDDWNHYERRAEEWAACMYSGAGSDTYFDDLNFENGRYDNRINDYYDILEWLREECPLLMCKYDEKKLREENEED